MQKYDIIHFEALGDEALHLKNETESLILDGSLKKDFNFFITHLTLCDYLKENSEIVLPDIITIKTHSKIPESYTNSGNKKSIITRSAGYDHVEYLQNIVNIASLREYCINAVAETAISNMFALSRLLNHYTLKTINFDRKGSSSFFELTGKTVTLYGIGKIGKRIYDILVGIGMDVQVVDIREKELKKIYKENIKFITKEEAQKNSFVIINAMNYTKDEKSLFYNKGYFSKDYLEKFENDIIFVNVTRGEIAPEKNLYELYNSGKIIGIGLDVFSKENEFSNILNSKLETQDEDLISAKKLLDLSINREGNIIVSPHQGFNSIEASNSKAKETLKHVVYCFKKDLNGFKEQLPYYK